MRLFVVLFILLAGCSTDESQAAVDEPVGGAGPGDTNGSESSDSQAKIVQEARVDWIVPVSGHCVANGQRTDPWVGYTHGCLDVDENSWGKHFEAIFESSGSNAGFDLGFYDDTNQRVGGAVELTLDGGDGTIIGTVPDGAVYALFNTCGTATGADYRSGNIL